MTRAAVRPRNDPAQYDDLTGEWWDPFGAFAALHWLAASRARLVPRPPYPGAPLLDVACGAGLLAPHLRSAPAGAEPTHGTGDGAVPAEGWRHVGVDLSAASLRQAREHGLRPVRGDALRLPFADGGFECVVAGEVLEHVPDLDGACAEIARVLAPGGTVVVDTIARTAFARVALVHVAERLPGGPPPRIHDPDLFVDPERLRSTFARHGVRLGPPAGLRPSVRDYLGWLRHRRSHVRMLPVRSTAGVYQASGVRLPDRSPRPEEAP